MTLAIAISTHVRKVDREIDRRCVDSGELVGRREKWPRSFRATDCQNPKKMTNLTEKNWRRGLKVRMFWCGC